MKFKEGLRRIWRKIFPKKIVILIDGENLYDSLISLGRIGMDFGEFKNRLIGKGEELARGPIYYTSVTTEIPEKTLRFFAYLISQGFEVISKPLLRGEKPKSEIDPVIAVSICRFAIDKEISTIILISGDHHFVSAVKFAKERKKKVIVVSSAASLSKELKEVSNEWLSLEEIIKGIPQKSKTEKKRKKALQKLKEGKKIILPTLEESR